MMGNDLKPNDWIDGFDGIGQLISLHKLPKEEFSPVIGGKEVGFGDTYLTVAIYKMLCDFDGKLRKRKRILSCNADYCRKISNESLLIVEKIKKENPEELSKYNNCVVKEKFGNWVDVWLSVPFELVNDVKNKITGINITMSIPFTYPEYISALKKAKLPFKVDEILNMDKTGNNSIVLSLFNEDFKTRNKRMLFTKANCKITRQSA